jgi:hypothetical protein
MLNALKRAIRRNKETDFIMEAAIEDIETTSIKDMFLDDVDSYLNGAEDDPEIAKLVAQLPDLSNIEDDGDETEDFDEDDIMEESLNKLPETILNEDYYCFKGLLFGGDGHPCDDAYDTIEGETEDHNDAHELGETPEEEMAEEHLEESSIEDVLLEYDTGRDAREREKLFLAKGKHLVNNLHKNDDRHKELGRQHDEEYAKNRTAEQIAKTKETTKAMEEEYKKDPKAFMKKYGRAFTAIKAEADERINELYKEEEEHAKKMHKKMNESSDSIEDIVDGEFVTESTVEAYERQLRGYRRSMEEWEDNLKSDMQKLKKAESENDESKIKRYKRDIEEAKDAIESRKEMIAKYEKKLEEAKKENSSNDHRTDKITKKPYNDEEDDDNKVHSKFESYSSIEDISEEF